MLSCAVWEPSGLGDAGVEIVGYAYVEISRTAAEDVDVEVEFAGGPGGIVAGAGRKQVPRCARNDRQKGKGKGKSNSKGNGKSQCGGPSLRSG